MKYPLKYGDQFIAVNINGKAQSITVNPVPDAVPDKNSFTSELSSLINPGVKSAAVVVSDKTRLCDYDLYLPWLTNILERKGLDSESITFYIAYGTHPRQSDSESLGIYGSTYRAYRFIHHDCDDHDAMIDVGVTEKGTRITIRKDILENELIILFGVVSHHYFAGYGGGRKMIFPGLAARDSIYHNHKLFIDFNNLKLNGNCRSGNLTGNPVAEDLLEIDNHMPEKILITGIPGEDGKIRSLLTGKTYDDFLLACKAYDRQFKNNSGKMFDNVIASAGGYPKDINFIQTHKSLHNAASFVRDGGNLILLSECRDGIGNEDFLRILEGKQKREIFEDLELRYSGNGGTALSLLSKTERINISMVTELSLRECQILGVNKIEIDNLQYVTGKIEGTSATIGNASIVYR